MKTENFRTLYCFLGSLKRFYWKQKKAATALKLAVSALYPGRESNPYSLNGHRILSPATFIENQFITVLIPCILVQNATIPHLISALFQHSEFTQIFHNLNLIIK